MTVHKGKRSQKIIKQYQSESVRKFKDRKAVFEYLEFEVFKLDEFKDNVSETARSLDVSYIIAYEVLTNYLTDVLYEIDQSIENQKQKRKINVYSYFSLTVGFMANLTKNKMYFNFKRK